MKRLELSGKWVLVTGASAGLGREMARQLAHEHRAHIVAIARRRPELELLKKELETQAGVQVHVISADLSDEREIDRALREATDGRTLSAAILNAGVTHFGKHSKLEWSAFEQMIRINVSGVVRATSALVRHFEDHEVAGGLLIVSSMAGIIPIPYQSAYSATKAFLLTFGCGLANELRTQGISVTVFAPGGIETDMTRVASFRTLASWLMPVDSVARRGLKGFIKREYVTIPGFTNQLGSILARLLPRKFLHSQMSATYRKALEQAGEL